MTSNEQPKPCTYPGHVPTYWTGRGSRSVVCGICHPPSPKLIACGYVVYINAQVARTWAQCPWCGSSGAVNAQGVGVTRRALDAIPCEHCHGWGCVPIENGAGAAINDQRMREAHAKGTRAKYATVV
jgi:hypothetical protein